MKKISIHNIRIDGLLALLLFGVFAVTILMVLLSGADGYRRLTLRDNSAWEQRTGVQYISTKVRQAHHTDAVSLMEKDGVDILTIHSVFGGEEYLTLVYHYDGWLREMLVAADELEENFYLEFGEKVMEAQGLSFTMDEGLLEAELTSADGQVSHLLLSLGREAAA